MFLGNIQVLEIGFELREGGSIWGVCGLRKWKKLLSVDIFLKKYIYIQMGRVVGPFNNHSKPRMV